MTFTSMSRYRISNVATSAKEGRTKKYQCHDITTTSVVTSHMAVELQVNVAKLSQHRRDIKTKTQ